MRESRSLFDRRQLLAGSALGAAAVQLAAADASAQTNSRRPDVTASLRAAFVAPKRINAGPLSVAYVEAGPRRGRPIILLHGWPYDVWSFEQSAQILVDQGYRVLAPYLRGYGPTRFLSPSAVRNGQQAGLADDARSFMDALDIEKATVAGFDWGARTAVAVGALWPERCQGIVSVSGYILANIAANQQPLPPAAELGWWYQYYFATERGRRGYAQNTRAFARLIWERASPDWRFDDETFARSAAAFDNPDHTDIVVHNYRWRLGLAEGEPQYQALEARLQARPVVSAPAITIGSDFDGAAADGAGYRDRFTGPYQHRVLRGIGHNVPQEAPEAFAAAVVEADRLAP